eukprot:gene4411-5167_t
MIKQRRESKTRALKAIEYINDKDISGAALSSTPFTSALDDYSGFEVQPHLQPVKPVISRPILNNSKKKYLVEQYVSDNFVHTEIIFSKGKGNGVKVVNDVDPGELVVEYKGELIAKTEALRREKLYAAMSATLRMECYLFYFEHKEGNLDPVKILVDGAPKIVLISNRRIERGEELFFDYGDRSSLSLAYFPWLRDDYKPMVEEEDDDEDEDVDVEEDYDTDTNTDTDTDTDTDTELHERFKRKEEDEWESEDDSDHSGHHTLWQTNIYHLHLSPSLFTSYFKA